jgi:competence protein ComEA
MNRRNLFIGALLAALLTLPLLAAAQGESGTPAAPAPEKPAQPAASTTVAKPKASTTSSAHHGSMHASMPKVNLNSATKEELVKLPGITDEIADKIIAARPFKSKNELVDKKLVSQAEYNRVHEHITVKAPEPKKS